jgi:hypothetical protein
VSVQDGFTEFGEIGVNVRIEVDVIRHGSRPFLVGIFPDGGYCKSQRLLAL